MSAELQFNAGPANTGLTVYAILRNAAGQPYNTVTPGFEVFSAGSIANYDIALIEQGASGYYVGDMPVVAAGYYNTVVKQRLVSDPPAVADTSIGGGEIQWSGTAVIPLSGLATAVALAAVAADLPGRITKNTALADFMFFMVDSSDHLSGLAGLTITATRSLDGAAFAACANAVAEVGGGWYKINFAATDLNANVVALNFTAVGADPRNITIVTQVT